MPDSIQVGHSTLRLIVGDITTLEIEGFVYYARHDLQLGSGYGTAIAIRGGPAIQEELGKQQKLETTQAVMTSAGKLKARWIIHAAGPRFQEEDLERKLRVTVQNCLALAEQHGIKSLAFPAMGAGFYGAPLPLSARVTLQTIHEHLSGTSQIQDVAVCLLDSREYKPFQEQLAALPKAQIEI